MKALILAGGFGTRLRPLSCTRPKLLFPIAGRTMLEWISKKILATEVDEVTLAVNYLAEVLEKKVGDKIGNVKINYSPEDKSLGTGGPLKNAEDKLNRGDTFLTMNGDIISEISLKEVLDFHLSTEAMVTVVLYKVEDPTRYGVAKIDEKSCIGRFIEKPKIEEAPSKWINAGIYLMEPEILKYIPPGRKVSLEKEIFPVLAKKKKLFGFKHEGMWFDVGRLEDYMRANYAMIETESKRQAFLHDKIKVKDNTVLVPPAIVMERVEVGDSSRIGPNSVVGQESHIGKNSIIKNSIIFENVNIGDSVRIENSVIGEGADIGNNVEIGRECIISDFVRIHDGLSISDGINICPYKEVEENASVSKHIK